MKIIYKLLEHLAQVQEMQFVLNAGATGDTPSPISTTFNSSATPAVYEAIVRGGTLRHDQTNYSTGYLPVGLNYHQVKWHTILSSSLNQSCCI